MKPSMVDLLGSRSVLHQLYDELLEGSPPTRTFLVTSMGSETDRRRSLYRMLSAVCKLVWQGEEQVLDVAGKFIFLPNTKDRAGEPTLFDIHAPDGPMLPMRWIEGRSTIRQAFHTRGFTGFVDTNGALWQLSIDNQTIIGTQLKSIQEPVLGPPILFTHPDTEDRLVVPLASGFAVLDRGHLKPDPRLSLRCDNRGFLDWTPLNHETALVVYAHRFVLLRLGPSGWMQPLEHDYPKEGKGVSRPVLLGRALWYVDGLGTLLRVNVKSGKVEEIKRFKDFKPCLPNTLATPSVSTILGADRRGKYFLYRVKRKEDDIRSFWDATSSNPGTLSIVDMKCCNYKLFVTKALLSRGHQEEFYVEVFRWNGDRLVHEPTLTVPGRLERVVEIP